MEKRRAPDDKIHTLILYFAAFCREHKKVVSKSLLHKFLFNLDFGHFALHDAQITDFHYRKDPFGPVPLEATQYLEQLVVQDGLIMVDRVHGEKGQAYQSYYTPFSTKDLDLEQHLNALEVSTLLATCAAFAGKTAAMASDESHCQYAWLAAEKKGFIPIEDAKYCTFDWLGYYGEGKDREDFLESKEMREDLEGNPELKRLMSQVVSGKRTLTTTKKPKSIQ